MMIILWLIINFFKDIIRKSKEILFNYKLNNDRINKIWHNINATAIKYKINNNKKIIILIIIIITQFPLESR